VPKPSSSLVRNAFSPGQKAGCYHLEPDALLFTKGGNLSPLHEGVKIDLIYRWPILELGIVDDFLYHPDQEHMRRSSIEQKIDILSSGECRSC
jgi:hypothetical protein